MSNFTTDQICTLREIERARRRDGGAGLRPELQAVIDRLMSGGVGSPAAQPGQPSGNGQRSRKLKGAAKLPNRDPRILTLAKVLWDRGWATQMLGEDGNPRYRSFADYLATIPDIPTFPETYDARFPHLVLVDRRIQVVEACQMLGVGFNGNNDTLVPHDPEQVPDASVYWMRCQDGKAHRNHKPTDCRTHFAEDEVGLDDLEGLALFAQYPDTLEVGCAIDLPGSVHAVYRGPCAYLRRWSDGDVRLLWHWHDRPLPLCGSASRAGLLPAGIA